MRPRAAYVPDPENEPDPVQLARIVPPWEPVPGEPDDAHQAFALYLDTDRTITAHAEALGASLSRIQALAARWRWRARRAAYRAHLRACALAAAEDETEEIAREHARGFALMRELGINALAHIAARGEPLDVRDALALAKAGIDGERLLGGQVTARTSIHVEGMGDAELEALHALMTGDADAARRALGPSADVIDATPLEGD